jgi:hypothetical protein
MQASHAARATPAVAERSPQISGRQAGITTKVQTTMEVYTEPATTGNPYDEPAGGDERVLDTEALTLFAAVHKLCGAEVARDRAWWTADAARRGSDWAGVLKLQADIVARIRRAA